MLPASPARMERGRHALAGPHLWARHPARFGERPTIASLPTVTALRSHGTRYPMLLFLVKAFSSVIWNLTGVGLLGDGHDRDGPLPGGGQAPIRSRGQQGDGIRSGRQIGSRPARVWQPL